VNIFDYITPQDNETFTTLLEHKNIKINRIVSAENIELIEYRQKEDEWLVVIEGEAILSLDDKEQKLSKGDTLFIPAKTPHTVLMTQKGTVWLTVHIF